MEDKTNSQEIAGLKVMVRQIKDETSSLPDINKTLERLTVLQEVQQEESNKMAKTLQEIIEINFEVKSLIKDNVETKEHLKEIDAKLLVHEGMLQEKEMRNRRSTKILVAIVTGICTIIPTVISLLMK